MLRTMIRLALMSGGVLAMGLGVLAVLTTVVLPDSDAHMLTVKMRTLVVAAVYIGGGVGAFRVARVLANRNVEVADVLLVGLKTVFDAEGLAHRVLPGAPDGRYAKLSESDLLDVYRSVKPAVAPEAAVQVLWEVRARTLRGDPSATPG